MTLADRFSRLRRRRHANRALTADHHGQQETAAPGRRCRYVAVIMDGNGRWAESRRLPIAAGHRAGVKALRRIIERALDHGIEELTIFSFSTENWRRPPQEVAALIDLFVEMIRKEAPDLRERGVQMRFIGRRTGVPPALIECIDESEQLTAGGERMTLYVAFNYGGRAELLDAARALAAESPSGAAGGTADQAATAPPGAAGVAGDTADAAVSAADADELRRYLYAPGMHDPELLIRTSGEMRISNFLLWQLAYTELYFTPRLWPDMDAADLDEALAEYAQRQRRYGGR
jgi:undecaprenyl diphosphate synthase